MGPLDHMDMSAAELAERVRGDTWRAWVEVEPSLGRLNSWPELRELRGTEADQLLGALIRLAAKDGGDDELAARAVAHQVNTEIVGVAIEFSDLGPEVDQVVMASLWLEIRTFPWRRRTRAYATSLRYNTRQSALDYLLQPAADRRRLVSCDPVELIRGTAATAHPEHEISADDAARGELVDYLRWCLEDGLITRDDAKFMLELIEAGWQTLDSGVLRIRRGSCSLPAVRLVAADRGVSPKTIIRARNRILALLRAASSDYLLEVA